MPTSASKKQKPIDYRVLLAAKAETRESLQKKVKAWTALTGQKVAYKDIKQLYASGRAYDVLVPHLIARLSRMDGGGCVGSKCEAPVRDYGREDVRLTPAQEARLARIREQTEKEDAIALEELNVIRKQNGMPPISRIHQELGDEAISAELEQIEAEIAAEEAASKEVAKVKVGGKRPKKPSRK